MDRAGRRQCTDGPSRLASSRASRWFPPGTRQHGRGPNPAVTSLTAVAARTSALTPLVTSTRDRYAASAGEAGQPATTWASEVPAAARAAAAATSAAQRATSSGAAAAPPRYSRW